MKTDEGAGPVGPPDEVKPNSPRPGNVQDFKVPNETGFLIVRLKPGTITSDFMDFGTAVREEGLLHIDEVLKRFDLSGIPLITSVPREQLRALEEKTAHHEFAPDHSLLSYWRVDVRRAGEALRLIEAALRQLPEVDLVYREKTVTDPLTPGDDPRSDLQGYLDQPEAGLNIRWVWDLTYGHGEGMRFVDLEQEWTLDHQDLPSPKLIFNDNRKGQTGFDGSHGTGVVGIVAGVDNAVGIIGIAPKVESVRLVSKWSSAYPTASYIAEAIAKAITTSPLPHVLLIEAQTVELKLPPEMDAAVLDAIRYAVSSGVIVVETAGNGNRNLDSEPDAKGHLRLNRCSDGFEDSGAILVGAATSCTPHQRSIWGNEASNYGSRIDCYAWGDSIVTCGSGVTSYRNDFGGTSGAAAIIAGCAILVQGLHFAKNQSLLSSKEMREMLSNPKTGIAPGVIVAGHIGVMPNLRAIVEAGKLGPNLIEKILRFIFRTGK